VDDLDRHRGHVLEVAVLLLGQTELGNRGLGALVPIGTRALRPALAGLPQPFFFLTLDQLLTDLLLCEGDDLDAAVQRLHAELVLSGVDPHHLEGGADAQRGPDVPGLALGPSGTVQAAQERDRASGRYIRRIRRRSRPRVLRGPRRPLDGIRPNAAGSANRALAQCLLQRRSSLRASRQETASWSTLRRAC
jgi:hypothetical protein